MLRVDGERVSLQEFTPAHLADPRYGAWLRDPDVVRGIHRLEYRLPLVPGALEAYVQQLWTSGTDCFFALHEKESNEFVGTVRLGHIDWRQGSTDLGILIGTEGRGRGFSADAVRTACGYAFGALSLQRVSGGTAANNLAMCRCFARAGFREEGRRRQSLLIDGARVDHVLFGLLSTELHMVQP